MKTRGQKRFISWSAKSKAWSIDLWNIVWSFLFINFNFLCAIVLANDYFDEIGAEINTYLILELLIILGIACFFVLADFVQYKLNVKIVKIAFRLFITLVLAYIIYKTAFSYYLDNAEEIEEGMLYFADIAVVDINKAFRMNLLFDDGSIIYADVALRYILVLTLLVLFLISFLLQFVEIFLILPIAITIAIMFIGRTPGFLAIGMLILDYLVLNLKRKKSSIIKANNENIIYKIKANAFVFALAGMFLFTAGYAFRLPSDFVLSGSSTFIKLQRELEMKINLFGINNKNARPQATLSNKRPKYDDTEIMRVKMDKRPQSNLYFKYFHGSDYVNHKWTYDDNYRENTKDDDYKIISELVLNGLFENWNVYNKETNYDIEYLADIGINLAVPYGSIVEEDGAIKISSDFLVNSKKKGKASFVGINKNVLDSVELVDLYFNSHSNLDNFLMWDSYKTYVISNYTSNKESIKQVTNIANYLKHRENWMELYKASYNSYPPMNDTFIQYDNLYGDYNGVDCSIINYFMARAVFAYLSNNYEYELDLDSISDNIDPVQYFLEKSHKGYCMHFATAGVMILRELGVPCRYASGYIAKESAFVSKNSLYETTILDKNSHAWVEIYIDRVGWVPIEMTPGFTSTDKVLPTDPNYVKPTSTPLPTTPPTSTPTQAITPSNEATPSPSTSLTPSVTVSPSAAATITPTNNPSESTPTPVISGGGSSSGGSSGNDNDKGSSSTNDLSGKKIGKVLKTVGLVILGLGLVVLAYVLIRKFMKRYIDYIEGEIRLNRYRNAINRINKRVYKRLKSKIHLLKRINDVAYLDLLKKNYPDVSENDWERYMDIVSKNAYSRAEMSKEETIFCYAIYKKMDK